MVDPNSNLWAASRSPLANGYVDKEKILAILGDAMIPLEAVEIARRILIGNDETPAGERLKKITVGVRNRLVYHRKMGRVSPVLLPGKRARGWVVVEYSENFLPGPSQIGESISDMQ